MLQWGYDDGGRRMQTIPLVSLEVMVFCKNSKKNAIVWPQKMGATSKEQQTYIESRVQLFHHRFPHSCVASTEVSDK